jgi:hypothetical protein
LNRTLGGEYRKKVCRSCDNQKRNSRAIQTFTERPESYKNRESARQKKYRSDPRNLAAVIYKDTRRWDKKHNFSNDLNREWITKQVANGCSYCGETELRMTLDRIDNAQGHTQTNVNAACIRCNYLRRDLPFAAWEVLIESVRKARELGAFGKWTGRTR